MSNQKAKVLSPVLYLPHGGGPLPVLGDKGHESLVSFWKNIVNRLGQPAAILVISAHWEEHQATVTGGRYPELVYDYYGFPKEAYEIQYAVPGCPELANETVKLLEAAGIPVGCDEHRGFDHGLFIPLKIMYPQADIPCIQLSLVNNMDPGEHLELGKSIAALREKNVLIIGSGFSFHNLKAFAATDADSCKNSDDFNSWLIETCSSQAIPPEVREQRLLEWDKAPAARFCHPREEHLLPLHVCYGIAQAKSPTAEVVFNDYVLGKKATGLLWQ